MRTYRIQSGVVRPSIGVRIGRVNNLGLYGKGRTEGSEGKGRVEAGRSQRKKRKREGRWVGGDLTFAGEGVDQIRNDCARCNHFG